MAKEIVANKGVVVVEVWNNKEKKLESGLYVPASVDKETQSQARVITVGPDIDFIKAGDLVIVSRIAGELFELDGRYYRAVKTADIFGVVRES